MAEGCSVNRQSGDFCAAINCTNARSKKICKDKKLSFYKLPKDEARCQEWIQNCRRDDLRGLSLNELWKKRLVFCSEHFEESQFNCPKELSNASRRTLKWNAVPALFNVPNPPPQKTGKRKYKERACPVAEVASKKKRTFDSLEEANSIMETEPKPEPTTSSQCQKMERKLKKVRNKLYRERRNFKRLETKYPINYRRNIMFEEIKESLPAETANFIIKQVQLISKKKAGRRWSYHEKSIALSMYHASRKCYKLLMKLFVLPSASSLRRYMRNINIYPGFNESLLQALKHKIQFMPEGSKVCSVVFDEISLKEGVSFNVEKDEIEGLEDFGALGKSKLLANHANVFMVRGLKVSWKQPVGYVLSSGPIDSMLLKKLLFDCLEKLNEIGLDVKCIIADQGTNNQKLFSKLLDVDKDKPYFIHKSRKYYVLYDPPHLLKNIRNNLHSSGFIVDGNRILWKHIVDFYELYIKNNVRLAPKLTKNHIELPPFSKLKVKYATQVLSHSVAAGLSFIGSLKSDQSLLATADFVDRFDKLFNTFNSRTCHSKQPMAHALSSNSGHIDFLNETMEWLEKLLPCSKRKTLPCLEGWKVSIKALISLWSDLNILYGFDLLFTDRLNQDCVENFFARIRNNNSNNDRPTPMQFRIFCARIMVDQIFSHPKNSNCEEDSDMFLVTLKELSTNSNQVSEQAKKFLSHSSSKSSASAPRFEEEKEIPTNIMLDNIKTNVVTYMSGYIIRKIDTKICENCHFQLISKSLDPSDHKYMFLISKQFKDCKEGLLIPSDSFICLVEVLENEYSRLIPTMYHISKLRQRLAANLKLYLQEKFVDCSTCCYFDKVIWVFLNIRINHSIKLCNLNAGNKSSKKAKTAKKSLKFSHE